MYVQYGVNNPETSFNWKGKGIYMEFDRETNKLSIWSTTRLKAEGMNLYLAVQSYFLIFLVTCCSPRAGRETDNIRYGSTCWVLAGTLMKEWVAGTPAIERTVRAPGQEQTAREGVTERLWQGYHCQSRRRGVSNEVAGEDNSETPDDKGPSCRGWRVNPKDSWCTWRVGLVQKPEVVRKAKSRHVGMIVKIFHNWHGRGSDE